jgi:hypothetical protein
MDYLAEVKNEITPESLDTLQDGLDRFAHDAVLEAQKNHPEFTARVTNTVALQGIQILQKASEISVLVDIAESLRKLSGREGE